jgi:hypothetical protein
MADSQQVQGRPSGARQQRQGQTPHVEPDHDAHGQSLASWTCVGVIMVGALIMGIGVVVATVWVFVVGVVVVVLGAIAGKVLAAMGFGVSGRPGH